MIAPLRLEDVESGLLMIAPLRIQGEKRSANDSPLRLEGVGRCLLVIAPSSP